jgi:hypothetical protein
VGQEETTNVVSGCFFNKLPVFGLLHEFKGEEVGSTQVGNKRAII